MAQGALVSSQQIVSPRSVDVWGSDPIATAAGAATAARARRRAIKHGRRQVENTKSGSPLETSRSFLHGQRLSIPPSTTSASSSSSPLRFQSKKSGGQKNRQNEGIVAVITPVKQGGQLKLPTGKAALLQLDLDKGLCSFGRKYSPELVARTVLASPVAYFRVAARGTRILTALSWYFGSLWWDDKSGKGDSNVRKRSAQLRELLVDLGPSFIKAGQVLANRPDIVREDYMNELCVLQDDVPPFPDTEAFALIEESIGRPISVVFSEISPKPIAAASLGQVYRAKLRSTGADVAVKVQRPNVEPLVYQDLFLFRQLARLVNGVSIQRLGCNAELIVDEFGGGLLEELDYVQESRNMMDFYENFKGDLTVKIPFCYRELTSEKVIVMEWIDGIRCTNPAAIHAAGIDIDRFITIGVSSALRQLLEFGLFHGDPHPGNIFAMRDGRIAYVDFGNVAELSQQNKQILIDAVVHAVNEDYVEMAGDFERLGFLAPGVDLDPIVPALENIWQDSSVKSLVDFNFRSVTAKFNQLVFQYQIRIPERYALVIRSLLTQEGICLCLQPNFKFLNVAYPYVAKRLLTDPDPALRERLLQVLFKNNEFQWSRLENLIKLAKEGGADSKLDLSETLKDGAMVVFQDESLRQQLIKAFTQDQRLHIREVQSLLNLLQEDVKPQELVTEVFRDLPKIGREMALSWSDRVLAE